MHENYVPQEDINCLMKAKVIELFTAWSSLFLGLGYVQLKNTVNSCYFGPLNCGHLNIAAAYQGTDLKLHQDCTILASDLWSLRYSVLQPLLETPISAIVFILQPEVMFVGVVMVKT